jgi:hypothetical protein
MDDKVKLTKCQNLYHHGGVFDTWTEWAKPPADRPNSLAGPLAIKLVQPAASLSRVYMRRGRPRRWRKAVGWPPLGELPPRPSRWSYPTAL